MHFTLNDDKKCCCIKLKTLYKNLPFFYILVNLFDLALLLYANFAIIFFIHYLTNLINYDWYYAVVQYLIYIFIFSILLSLIAFIVFENKFLGKNWMCLKKAFY